MKGFLFAAGRGERMRPLTDTVPKPLLEVGGKALVEHHIERLVASGIRELVVNLSWLGDAIRVRLGDGSRYGVSITYSEEGPQPLENAGGIVAARALLGDAPFVAVNADIWTAYPFSRLELPPGRRAHLVLVPNPAHNTGGDFCLEDGLVRNPGPLRTDTATFSGIAVYDPALFTGLAPGKRPLAPVLRAAADRGEVSGELWDGEWTDVGTPERLASLMRR